MKTQSNEANEQLLIEAAKRDPTRFAGLYEANFERVYAFIASRVRNRAEAEDLTSEVFHKALAHLNGFEWRGAPFAAWLFRIAANVITDQRERAVRERVAAPPDSLESPVDFERAEQQAKLFHLVRRLPKDQHRVIVMRFAEEKSIREIAEAIGRTEGAVKQLQFRAIENLRARVARETGGAHA